MEAAPVNIIQYFDGSKQGIIPLFQRPYSWESKDWSTLWDDLVAQYDPNDRASHFMGALVTVPVRSVPVGVTKHLVIDGQQRLTTLAVLLAAIRQKAELDGDDATAGIIGDLLINRHYKSPDDLKLLPTQVDRAPYNALVYGHDVSVYGEARIVQAFNFFKKKLSGKDPEDVAFTAAQTLQTIQQSFQVVMINLGEKDDPYLIFESLNHKGKPLNQADLVRNYVLMRFQHSTSAGGEQEAIYEDFWRPMEFRLGESMPEFLRHYEMRLGRNVRKGDIYTAAKIEFEKAKSSDEVKALLGEMKDSAVSYEKFISPSEEADERISKKLKAIQILDSTVFYPLLIRLYQLFERDYINSNEVFRCLHLLESFYVRRLVCEVPTHGLNKFTIELCLGLPEQEPAAWLLERLIHGVGSRRCPSDTEFSETIITNKIYSRRIVRYVLEELEETFSHKETVDASAATIEHIMPQTLSDVWKESLGENFAFIHEKWVDTLGNLTLTGYNSELSNSPFAEKEKLRNTHFELSRGLLDENVWSDEQIQARGKCLADRAIVRWCLK